MPLTSTERDRLRALVANIYGEGYAEGMAQAASNYDLYDLIAEASQHMKKPLQERLSLVDKAVDTYLEMIERKAKDLRGKGLSSDQIFVEVTNYAQHLADSKAQIITEMEFAEARMDGAGNLVDAAGIPHQWEFPHFRLTAHEECPICEEIREAAPYNQEDAEREGFPSVPHPNCDHSWVLVPLGEKARTTEFPA